jgi:hypothetical protein
MAGRTECPCIRCLSSTGVLDQTGVLDSNARLGRTRTRKLRELARKDKKYLLQYGARAECRPSARTGGQDPGRAVAGDDS